jgi:hypothetical protein
MVSINKDNNQQFSAEVVYKIVNDNWPGSRSAELSKPTFEEIFSVFNNTTFRRILQKQYCYQVSFCHAHFNKCNCYKLSILDTLANQFKSMVQEIGIVQSINIMTANLDLAVNDYHQQKHLQPAKRRKSNEQNDGVACNIGKKVLLII